MGACSVRLETSLASLLCYVESVCSRSWNKVVNRLALYMGRELLLRVLLWSLAICLEPMVNGRHALPCKKKKGGLDPFILKELEST